MSASGILSGALLGLIVLATACGGEDTQGDRSAPPRSRELGAGLPQLEVEVLNRLPHDPEAYTQGLVFHEGRLFESTGRYGQSTLRELDPTTGAVLRTHRLSQTVFGEGLAATPDHLVQLTWKELSAYFYDPATLEVVKRVSYQGEGWGLCFDGEHFYMTSGGAQLVQRDRDTFAPLSSVTISTPESVVAAVNELECVGDHIWANVYPTARVVQIEKATGRILATADLTPIAPGGVDLRDPDHVANGIAFDEAKGTFYITGKLWPEMLEVRFATPDP